MRNHLTEADERALAAAAGQSLFWRLARAFLLLVPIFWLAGAVGDLVAAHRLGAAEGISLRALVALWYSPDPGQAYSGVHLLAVKRTEAAFGKLLLAMVFLGAAISIIAESRRRNRIYAFLRAHRLLGGQGTEA